MAWLTPPLLGHVTRIKLGAVGGRVAEQTPAVVTLDPSDTGVIRFTENGQLSVGSLRKREHEAVWDVHPVPFDPGLLHGEEAVLREVVDVEIA